MRTKNLIRNLLLTLVVLSVAYVVLQDRWSAAESAAAPADLAEARLVVYYFAQGKNCTTCEQLPLLTREAMELHFQEELDAGVVVMRELNVDEAEHEHFIHDYQLYTKAIVLSRLSNGRELGWENLTEVWDLVYDRERFINLIRDRVSKALESEP